MKTTLDLPENLYRQAKIKAATEGRKLKDLVADGLNLLLQARPGRLVVKEPPSAYTVMKDACGCVHAPVTDLASNPRHMDGLGREH